MPVPRPTRRTVLLAAAAATVTTAVGPTSAAGAATGARITGERWLDARTVDLTVASPSVGASLPVRVILPTRYAAEPTRTWPVLHLLQGAHDDYTSWTRETDISAFLADKDVLAVMPSSGPTGIPTDWWNYGRNLPDYETFHVDEVMELLRTTYRAGTRRVVAGVSTGGYGAFAFAARRPGVFAAAASYSGILDTTAPRMPLVMSAIVARESLIPLTLWGASLLQRANWDQHNPYALAGALKGTPLYFSQGTGQSGGAPDNLEGALLEGTLWEQSQRFAQRLTALGVPATTHFYNGGAHAWPYWQQEFRASWPMLAAGLGLS
ncbi:alpha/beta hydrolase [Streptomyces phyllanthi]|uniref:Acyl-CoA:diacylglycerol acyltransferase n=1 Tax=Streptomyces phyllanthi TaxID=1803180 RepID=A0A5N8WAE4_9ACTN|nr:alpha/beta hydrolase family protein [Streptomyces phyllanthi]MPY43095.1 esterase [Streptomyces phyllanthi]